MRIKVGLIDDNPQLLQSIGTMLSCFEEVELVIKTTSHKELLKQIPLQRPQVLLMDIDMPEKNGIELTSLIKEQFSTIKILMLTVFDQEDKVFDAILAGANGYLLKDEKPLKIISSITDVMNGDAPMSAVIARKTLELVKMGVKKSSKTEGPNQLTERELEILQQMSKGLSYIDIGEKLFISPNTVRKHCNNIYEKLHVHNKVEAIQLGLRNNWISSVFI